MNLRKRQAFEKLMFGLTALCAALALTGFFFLLGYIAWHGLRSVNWGFLTQLPKPVGVAGGGIANSIVGSVKMVGLAALIAAPIGILGGVYLAEFGSNGIGFVIRFTADVLNGIPSIVIGIFAYTLIVVPMKRFSGFSGSAALALIMIPVVLRNTEEFVRLVPPSIREAGLALGIPQWKVILRVVLPTAAPGIITGTLLATSRIAGETAPLIFTAFGNRFWDKGFLNPMASLPHTIYTYAISPYKDWHSQAWAAALMLMLFVLGVNLTARMIFRPMRGAR